MSSSTDINPKVSVIMPVYNGKRFLREAIDSILNQTFTDFEFIIINDGSTDRTQEIIDSYNDARLVVIKNQQNIGLPGSLNKGLEIARGEYITRMDADDISTPDRLAKQVKFLDEYKHIGYVSNFWLLIRENGVEIGVLEVPTTHKEMQKEYLTLYCFNHGSSMFRKSCQKEIGFYRPEFECAEDGDFCLRFSEKFQTANIPEPLYRRRMHPESLSASKLFQDKREFVKLTQDLAKERRLYGKDRLQIPERKQEVIDYINSFKKRNLTRRVRAEHYFFWGKSFGALKDIKNSLKCLAKSFISDPFYFLYALCSWPIKKILKKIKTE